MYSDTNSTNDPKHWSIGTSTSIGLASLGDFMRCKMVGIDCVELGLNVPLGFTTSELEETGALVRYVKQAGLNLWSVHLPFGAAWDISIPSKDQGLIILAYCTLLKYAQDWGARVAVIHPSYEPISPDARNQRLTASQEALGVLAGMAEQVGIQLAVECLPRTCLGNSSTEIRQLIEVSSSLQVCLDSNHLLQEDTVDFVESLGKRILTLHVSDYDGLDEQHWLPGRGTIDWASTLDSLVTAGYRGPLMFEVVPGFDEEITPDMLMASRDHLLRNYMNLSVQQKHGKLLT